MCARRNPDAHAKLIGNFQTCDHVIRSWQGEYPKGLSYEQYEQAQTVRGNLWAQGVRKSEIVDVLERFYSETEAKTARRSPTLNAISSGLATQTHDSFRDLLVNHWDRLRWHRSFRLLATGLGLAEFGEIDIFAGDPSGPYFAVIEIEQGRDEEEVVESLKSYVAFTEYAGTQRAELCSARVEGIIVARKATSKLMKIAKAGNVGVYTAEVSLSDDRQASGLEVRVKLKKCR